MQPTRPSDFRFIPDQKEEDSRTPIPPQQGQPVPPPLMGRVLVGREERRLPPPPPRIIPRPTPLGLDPTRITIAPRAPNNISPPPLLRFSPRVPPSAPLMRPQRVQSPPISLVPSRVILAQDLRILEAQRRPFNLLRTEQKGDQPAIAGPQPTERKGDQPPAEGKR